MGVNAKITNRLDNNYVQVEITPNKSERTVAFKVPEQNANTFIANYKKTHQKTSIVSNASFVTAIVGGVLLSSLATKNLKNTALKWITNTVAGIVTAGLSIIGSSKYIDSAKTKLLAKHNAQELNLNA